MENIVKLYHEQNFANINKYIIQKPHIFNNPKYIYIRANTEFELKRYSDSYISFQHFLNLKTINNDQRTIAYEKSLECLALMDNNMCKLNYDQESIHMDTFKWIIPGILCTIHGELTNDHHRAFKFYNISQIIDVENIDNIENIDTFNYNVHKSSYTAIAVNYNDAQRIGTVIACYLMTNKNNKCPTTVPSDIINKINNIYDIELSDDNMEFIRKYHKIIWKRYIDSDKYSLKTYPNIYSLPFSKYDRDSVLIADVTDTYLLNNKIIITKKIDGIHSCLTHKSVFLKKHNYLLAHPIFDPLKEFHTSLINGEKIEQHLYLFGKVLMNLLSFKFVLFGVYDKDTDAWLSWNDTIDIANELGVDTVETIFCGEINDIHEINMRDSCIIRTFESFPNKKFNQNVVKYVPHDHEHEHDQYEYLRMETVKQIFAKQAEPQTS